MRRRTTISQQDTGERGVRDAVSSGQAAERATARVDGQRREEDADAKGNGMGRARKRR